MSEDGRWSMVNLNTLEQFKEAVVMRTTSEQVLGYIGLALACYGIAIKLGGVGVAALIFVAGGLFFEGCLLMEASRCFRRRRQSGDLG